MNPRNTCSNGRCNCRQPRPARIACSWTKRCTALRSRRRWRTQPFNAQGRPLPAALAEVDAAVPAAELKTLPIFALPSRAGARSGDLELIAERDGDGRIRRIQAREPGPAPVQDQAPTAWVIDASALRAPMRALRLEWDRPTSPVQAELQVEGSENLRDWYLLDPRASVVDLGNGEQRLQQRRIALDSNARYLRVQVLSGQLPPLRRGASGTARAVAPGRHRAGWCSPANRRNAVTCTPCRVAFRWGRWMWYRPTTRPPAGSCRVATVPRRHGYSVPGRGWPTNWAPGPAASVRLRRPWRCPAATVIGA